MTLDELQAPEKGAITDGPFGSNLTSAHYAPAGPRVVRLQNIGDGVFVDARAHISEEHFQTLRKHEVRAGDLLVASLGETLPRVCLAPENLGPAIVKADCIRVRPNTDLIDRRYLTYCLQAPSLRKWASDRVHGVGRPRLGLKTLRQMPVPVPRLDEQRRIVDILEDHFSRLDAAEAGAERGLRRLNSLEASVLAQCYRLGKPLPLGSLAAIQGGIQKQPKRAPASSSAPFLRVANVTARGLDLGDVHRIELFTGELEKLRLESGDLLVVEGNGSPSQIGRAALWNGEIADCVHQNHLIRVRPGPELSPTYLEAIWNAPQNRRQLTSLSSSSSGLHTLSVGKLKKLLIPVVDAPTQSHVTSRVREVRQARQRLQAELGVALTRGAGLRRSLLAAAFSGGLTSSAAREVQEMTNV